MCNNPKGTCIYLLMGFNNYLGPLVNVEGATSISIILLVDVDVGSFSPYKYVPKPSAKHIKTTVRGTPSLGNPSCSKLDFSPPSLADIRRSAAVPTCSPPASQGPTLLICHGMEALTFRTSCTRLKTKQLRVCHWFVLSPPFLRFNSDSVRSSCVRFVLMCSTQKC